MAAANPSAATMHALFKSPFDRLVAFRTGYCDVGWVQRGPPVGGIEDAMRAVAIGANGRYLQAGFKKSSAVRRVAIRLLVSGMARATGVDLVG